MYKFLNWFKPSTKGDMVRKEAVEMANYLISHYNVEEQTFILVSVKDAILKHRDQEIEKTKEYLNVLITSKEKILLDETFYQETKEGS